MKYLISVTVLLALVVIVIPVLLMTGHTDRGFRGQNDYYIGLLRSDGACKTVEVYDTDFQQAEQRVRDKYCENCIIKDLTPHFTDGGSSTFFTVAAKSCPLTYPIA